MNVPCYGAFIRVEDLRFADNSKDIFKTPCFELHGNNLVVSWSYPTNPPLHRCNLRSEFFHFSTNGKGKSGNIEVYICRIVKRRSKKHFAGVTQVGCIYE
jgi:hypothetical protein